MAHRVWTENRPKFLVIIIFAACFLLAGCRRSEPTPSPESELDMRETMPVQGEAKGYLHRVVRTKTLAEVELGIISVEHSIAAFNAFQGRLPHSLEELEANGYTLPELPPGKAFRYLPASGKVWVADVPRPPTETNRP